MKNRYGQLPKPIGTYQVQPTEMMFYQDMPIKMKRYSTPLYEDRISVFNEIILAAIDDFIKIYGIEQYINTYVYLSVKHLFQPVKEPFNRPGWHCDGFMTNDINYIWSDKNPTVFNFSEFILTQNDSISIKEMEIQANPENNFIYPENTLIRLNQYNVHRVADVTEAGMRAFIKISFSTDKYNLVGNSHNYLLDYNWEMQERNVDRNIPQSKI
ncbi:hypothetical protein [Flavobacterium sp.]|uniref:hypothetical protein n=1 Tax=Flavobacterium sp. TaxID=239 RepID=UPI003D6A0588